MRRNNYQYRVGEKILAKRKKKYKQKLEFMGPFLITQINYNGTIDTLLGLGLGLELPYVRTGELGTYPHYFLATSDLYPIKY